MCKLGKFVKIIEISEQDALNGYRRWAKRRRDTFTPLFFSHIPGSDWVKGKTIASDRLPKQRNKNGLWCWSEKKKNDESYSSFTKGQIKIWGTIVVHEYGYRAQFAKIVKIFPKTVKKKVKKAKV
jgi:hypothetical protein